jgi:threonyl-tRNA synthetase
LIGCPVDLSMDKINSAIRREQCGKIQRAEQMKVHTMFVIGKRDTEADAVSVRVHGKGNLGARPRAKAVADILEAIKERRG